MKDNQMKFKMTISKINVIKVGSVLSGKVEKGEITVGDKIEFEGAAGILELALKGFVVFVENMNCFILGKECIINLFVSCILAALLSFKSSEESKVQYSGLSAGIYQMF